jgi:hypothetical protein
MMGKVFFACASGSGVFNKKNIYGSRNSSGKKLKNISKRRKKNIFFDQNFLRISEKKRKKNLMKIFAMPNFNFILRNLNWKFLI